MFCIDTVTGCMKDVMFCSVTGFVGGVESTVNQLVTGIWFHTLA